MKKTVWKIPVVLKIKDNEDKKKTSDFPVDHYSYSSFTKFSSDPFMFKINYLNGESIESTTSAAAVLGKALHKAMQTYLGGNPDIPTPVDEAEAIKLGHDVGLKELTNYPEGFIKYNSSIPSRQKLLEKYAFSYFGYLKESNYQNEIKETIMVEKKLKHKVSVDGQVLPIPLKGYPDVVFRDSENRIIIDDHKFTSKFSPDEDVDGEKLIQSIFLFFLVSAEIGEIPYKIRFREFKTSKNNDKSNQLQVYEIVYSENPLAFDFFFRFYQDVTDALMGKQVFVPNIKAMYDKEISILAYIHRLDIDEERAKQFKDAQVDNITDFLKKKIANDSNVKRYLKTVASKFISAKTMNYKEQPIKERIRMKLAEHGMGLEFDSEIVGGSVTLYRYEPSIGLKMSKIEAYAKDIEQVVGVSGIRVLAPIPHSDLIGFEIPNKERFFSALPKEKTGYKIALGQTIMGETRFFDIREAPHMLIAGATGSGKSVLLASIITQLARMTKKEAELHLFDPKLVELSQFKKNTNVVEYKSDPIEIQKSLSRMIELMNKRYEILSDAGARNIEEYEGEMSTKFLVIDEFGDLVLQTKDGFVEWSFCDRHERLNKDSKGEIEYLLKTKKSLRKREIELVESVEECEKCTMHRYAPMSEIILTLAQKGRAAGIHIIIATQRPSVDIITGSIKANFPTKIALRTSKEVDSLIIIDQKGAEKLLGKGDMLFSSVDGIERLQGFSL